ncbi:hypothetical protein SY2F82_72120 [Streptomyces sp. Y2F8-2]|uniref:hypothetical protein n=1 Tax=Streptomyces sp. Y2F8-2 TaxID=2759675 RepID=UPI001903FBDD|nr:hypothetical protein [Streptomyces sp. Y2F8-2]GHK05415.1 hypothetical protein SY2F82_72120 [Streptomyces sp. Y2F8-2]
MQALRDDAARGAVAVELPAPPPVRTGLKTSSTVDKRCLINSEQAAALLWWVHSQPRTGQILHAFFATMYYAGTRPEEATALRV